MYIPLFIPVRAADKMKKQTKNPKQAHFLKILGPANIFSLLYYQSVSFRMEIYPFEGIPVDHTWALCKIEITVFKSRSVAF